MVDAIIRRVREDELAVLRMWQAAAVTPTNASDSIEGLTRLIREPAAVLLVATINDQIVGSVIGGWDGWRGNIYRLAVIPEHRRKRIARQLLAEITRGLFAKDASRLSALVEHEHQWATDFGIPCLTWVMSAIRNSLDTSQIKETIRARSARTEIDPQTKTGSLDISVQHCHVLVPSKDKDAAANLLGE